MLGGWILPVAARCDLTAADVVHLDAEMVANTVRQKRQRQLALHGLGGARLENSQVAQNVGDTLMRVDVQIQVGPPGTHHVHQSQLHVVHAIKVAGVEHVGIGSDRDHRVIEMSAEYIAELKAEEGPNFDEADWPLFMDELNGPRRMEVVWDGLKAKGLAERELELVMGKNVQRVYEQAVG